MNRAVISTWQIGATIKAAITQLSGTAGRRFHSKIRVQERLFCVDLPGGKNSCGAVEFVGNQGLGWPAPDRVVRG
jgi:hypothetical protein